MDSVWLLEVNLAAAPFDTQDFGCHQDVPRHQAKIFIGEITHRGIEIATAHAGMQIGDAVLPVIGRGVLDVIHECRNVVTDRSGQRKRFCIQSHILVGFGDAAGVAGAAAHVEHLPSCLDFLLTEGDQGAIAISWNSKDLGIPLGGLGGGADQQSKQHWQGDQQSIQ